MEVLNQKKIEIKDFTDDELSISLSFATAKNNNAKESISKANFKRLESIIKKLKEIVKNETYFVGQDSPLTVADRARLIRKAFKIEE